jgi:hypothetical protein
MAGARPDAMTALVVLLIVRVMAGEHPVESVAPTLPIGRRWREWLSRERP